jgi:paraquat-inducible protein B
MVQAIGSATTATLAGGNGGNAGSQIAALQKKLVVLQKQIQEAQSNLLAAPEGRAREAVKTQLDMLAAQMQMIQKRIADLQRQQAEASAARQMAQLRSQEAERSKSVGGAVDGSPSIQVDVYV